MKGAPTALTIGFLLAAPTVNPVVFWATWIAFRDQPEIVFLRVGFTLLIAVTIALVFSRQEDLRPFLQDNLTRLMTRPAPAQPTGLEDDSPLLRSGTFLLQAPGQVLQLDANPAQVLSQATTLAPSWRARWGLMVDNMVLEMRELGAVLVLGSAIAAIVQVAIPREVVLGLGQGPVTSILAMMALAWVVSICSTVDAFFALSFSSLFTSGSLLAFLVFGPMIDLKNISLLLTVFKGRAIVYLFVLAAQITFLLALLMNLYGG
jgi:uncharacterized membrane protein YraQ (UPF0718 family)